MRTVHGIHHGWRDEIHPDRRGAILDWLRRNGTDPFDVVNVRLAGEGALELEVRVRDADGSLIFDVDHVRTHRVTVAIAEPPPPEWWDDAEVRV